MAYDILQEMLWDSGQIVMITSWLHHITLLLHPELAISSPFPLHWPRPRGFVASYGFDASDEGVGI